MASTRRINSAPLDSRGSDRLDVGRAERDLRLDPAPGFFGRYRIVFSDGRQKISVRVVIMP